MNKVCDVVLSDWRSLLLGRQVGRAGGRAAGRSRNRPHSRYLFGGAGGYGSAAQFEQAGHRMATQRNL